MDSGAKMSDKTIEESMKDLKIDSASKSSETNMSGPREGSASDATSCISTGDATTGSIKGSEADQESFVGDQGMYYYGYCYPGFNSPFGEWDDQSYFVGADNYEMQPSPVQADNGPLLYYLPGYQSGYPSYNPMLPGTIVGVDGQYVGQPSYYPSPMLQQPLGSPGFGPQSVAYGAELVPAYPWDSSLLLANGIQVHGAYGGPTTPATNSSFSSPSQTLPSSKSFISSKFSTSDTKGSSLGFDVKSTAAVSKQSLKPVTKGAPPIFSKGYVPINKIPLYAQGKGGILYPNSPMNVKESGRSSDGVERTRARTKLHGPGDFDLSEQNRGPRTNSNENFLDSRVSLVESPDAGKNGSNTLISTIRKDMHNLPDFTTKYDYALFFVIKSYSEDDIHKSIKYNVWASTPNGNRRLDNAFQLAQEKMAEMGSKCPVFLFFSVNASGQFCGVAEMLNRVDFNKNMDFWQQDKWNGFFPVKWHIIKDVPNPQFRHILLENNENKPVTNSRDTQEVKFSQGTEMLNIFKNYSSKTSILDDFDFYENRQKVMQHKRNKPPMLNFYHPSPPKIEEVTQVARLDSLKPVSSLQSVEVESEKVKEALFAGDVTE